MKSLNQLLIEAITLDVSVGDTIRVGKFLNKKLVVKSIALDDHGMPIVNGRQKLAKFRYDKTSNESIERPNNFKKELILGILVEFEHTTEIKEAKQIALEHLEEDQNYYSKLYKAGLIDEPKALKYIKMNYSCLDEGMLGYMAPDAGVYKDPQIIKNMPEGARAISTPKGELFIADDPYNYLHSSIAQWINKNTSEKVPNFKKGSSSIGELKKGYILWLKQGNEMVPSTAYMKNDIINNYDIFDRMVWKLNKKFGSKFKFNIDSFDLDEMTMTGGEGYSTPKAFKKKKKKQKGINI